MITAAHAASVTGPNAVGPAVIVAVVLMAVCKFSLSREGKGTVPGRLLAILLAMTVAWMLLAVVQPAAATQAAATAAAGTGTLLSAIASILHGA